MDSNPLRAQPIRQSASYAALVSAPLSKRRTRATEGGAALVEVLIAIFIMGIGLLALLTLFPLGAIEMAQAIQDDRTAAVAADAIALSEAGKELVSRTMDFVKVSLSNGSADTDTAAQLRDDYERLGRQGEGLELRLQALQHAFPRDEIQPYLGPLLVQLRSIKWRIVAVVHLLSLLESEQLSQSSRRNLGYLPETVCQATMVVSRPCDCDED